MCQYVRVRSMRSLSCRSTRVQRSAVEVQPLYVSAAQTSDAASVAHFPAALSAASSD